MGGANDFYDDIGYKGPDKWDNRKLRIVQINKGYKHVEEMLNKCSLYNNVVSVAYMPGFEIRAYIVLNTDQRTMEAVDNFNKRVNEFVELCK